MKYLKILSLITLFLSSITEDLSATPNTNSKELSQKEDKTILLSTPRSGSSLIARSFVFITKRPLGGLQNEVLLATSTQLNIELISNTPFLYTTHSYAEARAAPPTFNKLILVERNLKELLFRNFTITQKEDLLKPDLQEFINMYLKNFETFDNWPSQNRLLVLYEDTIGNLNKTLSDLLNFTNPTPPFFFEEYTANQKKYTDAIYNNYVKNQYTGNSQKYHGISAKEGPQAIFYSKDQDPNLLQSIDTILEKKNPKIWNKYLKRFATN